MALDCWKDGVLPGLYEVDHAAIVEKPYVSIRKITRWTEEYDVADMAPASDIDERHRQLSRSSS